MDLKRYFAKNPMAGSEEEQKKAPANLIWKGGTGKLTVFVYCGPRNERDNAGLVLSPGISYPTIYLFSTPNRSKQNS